jgi:hypothetical protein
MHFFTSAAPGCTITHSTAATAAIVTERDLILSYESEVGYFGEG